MTTTSCFLAIKYQFSNTFKSRLFWKNKIKCQEAVQNIRALNLVQKSLISQISVLILSWDINDCLKESRIRNRGTRGTTKEFWPVIYFSQKVQTVKTSKKRSSFFKTYCYEIYYFSNFFRRRKKILQDPQPITVNAGSRKMILTCWIKYVIQYIRIFIFYQMQNSIKILKKKIRLQYSF